MLGGATAAALALSEQSFDPRASVAGTLFAEALPRFVVALGRGDLRNAERARQQATGDAARVALGEKAATHLVDVLTAAESLAQAQSRAEARPARDRFLASAASLNRALAAEGLPYFVDSDATLQNGRIAPVLTTYYVEREALVTGGGNGVRAVQLWRLDDLNLREGYLGYTRPSTPAALVLLDQIESDLVRYVLPALPQGEVMLLVDERTERQAPAWAGELSRVAASAVRRHYATLPAEASADVERMARLLARRRALVRRWRASAPAAELRVPERLLPEAAYTTELERRVPSAELREWQDIQEELLEPESVAAFDRVRDRYVASVERHEVQHRIDYRRGLIPVPAILAQRLDVENPLDASQTSLAGRARDELSAYLAAIAQAPDSPLLDLVLLSRFLFDEDNLGGPYCYAALAAYEGIAGELGIEPGVCEGEGDAAIDRARVAELFRRITARPPAELRAAAARFYSRCFGQPVPEVHRSEQTVRAPWRH